MLIKKKAPQLNFKWLEIIYFHRDKELGRFVIQTCPTYGNEKWSRRILCETNIFCQYIILTIWKHDTFCWMTITFIEKIDKKVIFYA